MSELIPIQDEAAAREFLAIVNATTMRRGQRYFADGRVGKISGTKPGTEYQAPVRGSQLYTTKLNYQGGAWYSSCTCPVFEDCKHAVALMLKLLDHARQADANRPADSPVRAGKAIHLEAVVAAAVNRSLTTIERQFVKQLQQTYRDSRHYQAVTPNRLLQLFPRLNLKRWRTAALWSQFPASEAEFWQYLAAWCRIWEVRPPEFMTAIPTDLKVERIVTGLWRGQQIEQWQTELETRANPPGLAAMETRTLEFRLLVSREKLVLESRALDGATFQLVKSPRLRQLMEAYQAGNLTVHPHSLVLWNTLADFWLRTYRIDLHLHDADMRRVLGTLLRAPGLEDRILTRDGAPFVRVSEPLRWQLKPVGEKADDYELQLVTADGTPPPARLLLLPGRPALYLSETTMYHGPPPWKTAGEGELSNLIPAPALESPAGMQFLARLGVALPPQLQAKSRRATMKVKIVCDLKPAYPAATTEALFVRVEARADAGSRREFYTVGGWYEADDSAGTTRQKAGEPVYLYDDASMAAVPALLDSLGLKWSGYDDSWYLRLTKNFPEKFVPWLAALPPHFEVLLDKQLATLQQGPVSGSVRLDCQAAGVDWFDLQVVLDVQDTQLTAAELKILLNARGGYVRLGKKGWRRLEFDLTAEDDEHLSQLGLATDDFSAEPQRLHVLQLAHHSAARFLSQPQVAEIRRRVEELKTRVAPPVPELVTAQLRPYQVEGFHFLAYLTANRFGGILADDMGLGKTLQTLTWLVWLRAQSTAPIRPSLVVCPKSVMDNWHAESIRFVPGLRVRLWKGADAAALKAALAETDLLVINYSQLRALGDTLDNIKWLVAILDEGQYIKNPESKTARIARTLKADHRLVLTGTPIENRLLDLWSLMAFAMPGVLGNRAQFGKRFDQAGDLLARRRLAARVRPFLLRRTKGQVATELPDRVEEDLLCEMEGAQQTLYRAAFKHTQQMLLKIKNKADFDRERFSFLTALLRLRQICCHPALVDKNQANTGSAKVNAMLDLLEPLLEEGHKVLVFSQFVSMIDLLEPMLREHQWPYFRLTGETENRGELVQQFQSLPGSAVFLISLKAGGFGLNLTAASYVLLFDPWWNPAVENQAIDRTHRIGQTRKVMAYRLLIKDSIEEKIRALQRTKSGLANDILGEENFAKTLTLDDLKFLFAGDPEPAAVETRP